MMDERIKQIEKDIELYRQAIENAEGALDAAEKELEEVLEERYAEEGGNGNA